MSGTSQVVAHCLVPGVPSGLCGGGIFSLSGLATSIATAIIDGLVAWVASGAAWLLGQVAGLVDRGGGVDLGAPWFAAHLSTMARLAGVLALIALVAAAIEGVLSQQGSQMVRAVVVRLPTAALVTAGAVMVTQMALKITDQLCALVSSGTGREVTSMLNGVAQTLVASSPPDVAIPGFLTVVLGLIVSFASLCLLLELVLRGAAIYIAVLFLPLVMALSIWPRLGGWSRRLIETLLGLIVAKFVIVSVLVLAAAELSSGIRHHGITAILGGIAMLLLATFAPFAVLRLIPIAEMGAHGALEGHRQRVTRATTAAAMNAQRLGLMAASGGTSGGLGVASVAPSSGSAMLGGIGERAANLSGASGSHHAKPFDSRSTHDRSRPPIVGGDAARRVGDDKQTTLLPRVDSIHGGRHGLGRDDLGVQLRWIPNDNLDPKDRG